MLAPAGSSLQLHTLNTLRTHLPPPAVTFEGRRPMGESWFPEVGRGGVGGLAGWEMLRGKQHVRVQHAWLMRSLALAAPLG